MASLKIANWDKWQTFRSGRGTPPWIKLYRSLFSNTEWACLTDSEKGQLVSLWILAADRSGSIPADPSILRKVCQLDDEPNIKRLIDLGFLTGTCQSNDGQMVDNLTPTCPQLVTAETETETEERQSKSKKRNSGEYTVDFVTFYAAWIGTKKKKANAFKEWKKLRPDAELQEKILLHLLDRQANDADWIKDGRKFQGHPDTFLKERKWEDEWKAKPTQNGNGKRRLSPSEEYKIERAETMRLIELENKAKQERENAAS